MIVEFLTTTPSWFTASVGWVVGIIGISFAVIQAYARGFSETAKIKSVASKDLIMILQTTVDTLKEDVVELKKSDLSKTKEISRLSGQNKTLTEILQGRDEEYTKFQEEGFAAFKRIADVHETLAKQNTNIEKLMKILENKL